MATVSTGVGYAMYWTAKRYVYPLIAPPTPPQLEQDKASIDASFEKAFALLDQLATDTQGLKDAESARKERLDHALAEVEGVVGRMKEVSEVRETEAKRVARELEEIREGVPMAIAREREGTDAKLREVVVEMKSLKTLVGNRMAQAQGQRGAPAAYSSPQAAGGGGVSSTPAAYAAASPVAETVANGTNGTAVEDGEKPASTSALPERSAAASTYGRTLGAGKAPQIPAWQLAAKKKADEAKKEGAPNGAPAPAQDVSESGTVKEGEGGA